MIRLATLILALLPLEAVAAAWVVDPTRSEILFTYLRADQPAEGRFARFAGEGVFDPANPGKAKLEIRIDSASIDLGEPLASAFATSAEWFDSRNHPTVTYTLDALEETSPGEYAATGRLTVRGKTEPITSPLRLSLADGQAVAEGDLTVARRSYRLGVGPAAAFVSIGPDVTVSFRLRATAAE
ncbi:MAG: YceI family protein [Pseudomonadota bacterium]